MLTLLFLSSGLFLGWSLGANNGPNIYGTAVGTKMLSFKTAAIISSVFIVIGALISGTGTSGTINALGEINAIAGSFLVALAAALAVLGMSKLRFPASISQSIVGAIIGWNFYVGLHTNLNIVSDILLAWISGPILAALFAMAMFLLLRAILRRAKIHILRIDLYTRIGLIITCAAGGYALGANNIGNVMGVFVSDSPFSNISVGGLFNVTNIQQLFLLGGFAIALGVFTYSYKVIETVGGNVVRLSPESALIVVMAHSIVLFIFSSVKLHDFLVYHGIPALPLVPVSSSQAIIGGLIGIGIIKGARNIRYKILGEIALGWLITPILAGVISFTTLFFMQNVFNQDIGSAPKSAEVSQQGSGQISSAADSTQFILDE